jgi:hypothetical protein
MFTDARQQRQVALAMAYHDHRRVLAGYHRFVVAGPCGTEQQAVYPPQAAINALQFRAVKNAPASIEMIGTGTFV